MDRSPTQSSNAAQIEHWNSGVARNWVRFQQQLDRQIESLGEEAMRVLAPVPGERLIDIGCGCGQTTLALASRVGPDGSVLGVDISAPMLEVARRRTAATAGLRVAFRQLDAQVDALGTGAFDAAFSRFGVMFFADPVAAFANIRGAIKAGGRLGFVCWRALDENVWMKATLDAARPLLPPLTPPDPTAPGPFAFADAVRLRSLLRDAGFTAVSIDPFDASIGSGDIEQTLQLTLKVGALGAALREHPDREPFVIDAVRAALAPYATPAGVMMPAAVWIVHARNG
jgi:ubiquinone/menaquinone biosynthesis C-methylase UbiE